MASSGGIMLSHESAYVPASLPSWAAMPVFTTPQANQITRRNNRGRTNFELCLIKDLSFKIPAMVSFCKVNLCIFGNKILQFDG